MERWRITPAQPTDSAPAAEADTDVDTDPMLTDDSAEPYAGGQE
jgi:hypothetical protein